MPATNTLDINIPDAASEQKLPFANRALSAETQFTRLVGNLLQTVMVFALLLLLFYLVWGSIEWITAGGDSGKIQSARNKMTQAVIGIFVLASVVALFILIQSLLGLEIFTFSIGSAAQACIPSNTNTCPGGQPQ